MKPRSLECRVHVYKHHLSIFSMSELDLCSLRRSRVTRVWPGLMLSICLLLSSARAVSEAQSDSDHLQQSTELMSAGDLQGAEKEARLALNDSITPPLACATL